MAAERRRLGLVLAARRRHGGDASVAERSLFGVLLELAQS